MVAIVFLSRLTIVRLWNQGVANVLKKSWTYIEPLYRLSRFKCWLVASRHRSRWRGRWGLFTCAGADKIRPGAMLDIQDFRASLNRHQPMACNNSRRQYFQLHIQANDSTDCLPAIAASIETRPQSAADVLGDKSLIFPISDLQCFLPSYSRYLQSEHFIFNTASLVREIFHLCPRSRSSVSSASSKSARKIWRVAIARFNSIFIMARRIESITLPCRSVSPSSRDYPCQRSSVNEITDKLHWNNVNEALTRIGREWKNIAINNHYYVYNCYNFLLIFADNDCRNHY